MTKLDQFDYAGATAIAVIMLVFSLILLLPINLLQKWSSSREEKTTALVTEEIR
jgi:sulfate/thiosulfate transport system permease protein